MTIFMKAYINKSDKVPTKQILKFICCFASKQSTFKVILFNLSFNNDKMIVVGLSTFRLFNSKILPKRHSNLHIWNVDQRNKLCKSCAFPYHKTVLKLSLQTLLYFIYWCSGVRFLKKYNRLDLEKIFY